MRPSNLLISQAKSVRIPPIAGMVDLAQRARIIHALANHELQAVELFAWGMLAYRDAPLAFRRGLFAILKEEQDHLQRYMDCLRALGHEFGDFPVTGHFWHQVEKMPMPSDFVSVMGLTFENANLDFAMEYREAALRCGDQLLADTLLRVHADEIGHVGFAWRWFRRFVGADDSWTKYVAGLPKPLSAARARGRHFHREARVEAGLDPLFIDELEQVCAKRPSGEAR